MSTNNGGGKAISRPQAATLKDILDRPDVKEKLSAVASKYVTADELIRLALVAASRQPELLRCTPASVLRSLMDAAQLGIRPGGVNGRGYLVPRMNRKVNPQILECCFDPGWRGLVDIARRSGEIISISAHVVRERDTFEVTFGTNHTVLHKPCLTEDDPGGIVAAYAVAKLRDESQQVEVLTRADLSKIRRCSAARSGGPWADWEDEMARKSAVRRIVKYLPVENHEAMARALELAAQSQGLTAVPQRQTVSLNDALSHTPEGYVEVDSSPPDVDDQPIPEIE